MMNTVTTPYDVTDYLQAPEEIAAYLAISIEETEGDSTFVANALGDIAFDRPIK